MSPLLFSVLTLLIAISAAALVTFLVDGFTGYMTFFLCIAGALIFAVAYGLNEHGNNVDATRTAIEGRYDVDFSTGSFEFGNATFIKDGDLYTCTIAGMRNEARMFCDEPPRTEYVK